MDGRQAAAPRWITGIEPAKELLKASGTQILEIECRQQPARLSELLQAYARDPALCKQMRNLHEFASARGPILFLGMGASYCSAISASTPLQSHGHASFTVDASERLHYGTSTWNDAALSILLTTSRESAELV
jgi:glucosamine--fructose-6-phosphate aminotransferase (isomerizing)